MKKKKLPKKKRIAEAFEFLLQALFICGLVTSILLGLCKEWIWFGLCLAATIGIFFAVIPICYYGIVFECPRCGKKFKANPYKVFFTNFIYFDFFTGVYTPKKKYVKCPDCGKKVWCKAEISEDL